MINSLIKSFSSVCSKNFAKVLTVVGGVTAAVLVIFIIAITAGFSYFTPSTGWGWLDSIITAGYGFVSMVTGYFLCSAFFVPIADFFKGDLLNKIEKDDYGLDAPEKDEANIIQNIGFMAKMLLMNIVILPTMLFFPLYIVLFTYFNGKMMGTEVFRMITDRRISRAESDELIAENKFKIYIAGAMISYLMAVPIVNFIMPLVGVVFMTHIFHQLQGSQPVTMK